MIENGYQYVVAIMDECGETRTVCALPHFYDLSTGDILLVGQDEKRYVCASAICFIDRPTYDMLCVLNAVRELPVAVGKEIVTIERFLL